MLPVTFDHCVIHVTDWERSNAFYTTVMGAELVARAGRLRLSLRRPPAQRARAGRDAGRGGAPAGRARQQRSVFRMARADRGCASPISNAAASPIERGPMQRFGAKGAGTSVYFRDPDGSLMEFISYARMRNCSLPVMGQDVLGQDHAQPIGAEWARAKPPARTTRLSFPPTFRPRRTTAPRGIFPA